MSNGIRAFYESIGMNTNPDEDLKFPNPDEVSVYDQTYNTAFGHPVEGKGLPDPENASFVERIRIVDSITTRITKLE